MSDQAPEIPETPRCGVPEHLAAQMTTAEKGEYLTGVFKRHRVTRRAAISGSLGTLGVLGLNASPWAQSAVAATRRAQVPSAFKPNSTGVNVVAGRHIGFGNDARTQMFVSGEFFDFQGGRPKPADGTILVDYGLTSSYGQTATAEIRQLVSTVPSSDSNGNATFFALTQYFVHALLGNLTPGTTYHWRFRLTTDGSSTADATFSTAPAAGSTAPFTFTAFADHGINVGSTPDPYKPNTAAGVASSDYYSDLPPSQTGRATPTKASNPPLDPYRPTTTTDGSDPTTASRSASGRRQDGVANRTQYPCNSLVDVIVSQRPVFNLVGGDIAYADPSGNGLAEFYGGGANPKPTAGQPAGTKGYPDTFDPTIWSAYFAQNDRSASNTAWMYALGNHDIEAVYDGDPTSSQPQNGYGASLATHGYTGHAARIDLIGGAAADNSPSPSVYSFRYGNVGVVAIDCNDLSLEIQSSTGYTNGAQASWLDGELAKLRRDSTIDYIVAFFHHCAYATSNNHHSDAGVRSVVGPLFTKYQVDVVFQGHNHQFERSDPLKYTAGSGNVGSTTVGTSAPDGSTVAGWQGTTYVNNGSAGRPRYGIDPDALVTDPTTGKYTERYRGNPNTQGSTNISGLLQTGQGSGGSKQLTPDGVTWSQARYDDYAVVVVDVAPAAPGGQTSMVLRTLNDFGAEIDRVTLAKTAGANAVVPPSAMPEVPRALLLPAAGLVVAGGAYAWRRHSLAEASVPGAPAV